jgi:hypothetical protein
MFTGKTRADEGEERTRSGGVRGGEASVQVMQGGCDQLASGRL